MDRGGNRVSDISPPGDVSGPLRLRLAVGRASVAAPLGRLTVRCRPWLDVEVEGRELLDADARGRRRRSGSNGWRPAGEKALIRRN